MAESFRYFGGIDFSGAREPLSNLWTAIGEEESGRLRIVSVRPHAFRSDLRAFVAEGWRSAVHDESENGRILWGGDFPMGLPLAVTDQLLGGSGGSWRELIGWVADRPADEVREAAAGWERTGRATDTGGALAPLDIRLYKQTVEGLRWLHELLEENEASVVPQALLPDAAVALIEVYPSATAQELGLPRRRAPARAGEIRARAAALRTFLRFEDAEHEAIVCTLEDAWDATIACLTAWLARADLEQPSRAGASSPAELALEGWIYRPPESLP